MKAILIIVIIFLSSICFAEIYKWVDDKGTVHFTEDPATIPEKYKDSVKQRATEERGQPNQPSESVSVEQIREKMRKSSKPVPVMLELAEGYYKLKYVHGYMMNNTERLIRSVMMEINCYDERGTMVDRALIGVNNLEPGVLAEFKNSIVDSRTKTLKLIRFDY